MKRIARRPWGLNADPLTAARRRTMAFGVLSALLLAASAWTSFSPIESFSPLPSVLSKSDEKAPARATKPPLSSEAFLSRKLLGAPIDAKENANEEKSPSFQAGSITLVAIVSGSDEVESVDPAGAKRTRKAALYSEASDRFLLVAAGETFGDATIDAVTYEGVEITQNGERKKLTLDRGPRTLGSEP